MVRLEPNRLYDIQEIHELQKQQAVNIEANKAKQLKRGADNASLDIGSNKENHGRHFDGDSCAYDNEFLITENCDQVRRKITTFIDNGGAMVKDFIDIIGVSSASYYGFMKQHGKRKGSNSDTYVRAFRFFQHRDALGLPMPKKRKLAALKASNGTSAQENKQASIAAGIANIQLEGEEDDAVEVYDSCDEIRRKINAHLRKPGVTQAQFLRDLHAQFHGPRKPKALLSTQLNKFRGQRGAMTGNTSGIYYAAYVFFEKERLAAGRPETEHRLDMEHAWCLNGGVDRKTVLNNVRYIVSVDKEVYMDDLGRTRCF